MRPDPATSGHLLGVVRQCNENRRPTSRHRKTLLDLLVAPDLSPAGGASERSRLLNWGERSPCSYHNSPCRSGRQVQQLGVIPASAVAPHSKSSALMLSTVGSK